MIQSETGRPRYATTAEDSAWFFRRLGYYLAHALVFFVIVKWIGPDLIIYCQFSSSPDYYAKLSQPYMPMIAAIKAYQRDHRELPETTFDMPEKYQPTNWDNTLIGTILGASSVTFELRDQSAVLEYEFTPESEGWIIHAPRCQKRLPLPIVPAAPSLTNALVAPKSHEAN